MSNKMIIDASHPEETRVVVLRGARVDEFDFESANKKPLRGNIYLAKVTRVEPSLQAAFVDYGGNRHGFLAFSEIHPDYYQIPVADRQALLEEEARSQREAEDEPNGERRSRRRRRSRGPESEMRASDDERVSESAAIDDEAGEFALRAAEERPPEFPAPEDFAPPEAAEAAPEPPLAEPEGDFGAPPFVEHHSEFLSRHVDKLPAIRSGTEGIVYHDPCYLGRYRNIYDQPRKIITRNGQLLEAPRSHARSFCCGAGGGLVFLGEETGERIGHTRAAELISTGAQIVATACPFCNSIFRDALAEKGDAAPQLLDIAQLTAQNLPVSNAS